MILRKILITLAIIVTTVIISSELLIIGNLRDKSSSEIEIYTEPINDIVSEKFITENIVEGVLVNNEKDKPVVENNVSEIEQIKSDANYNENLTSITNDKEVVANSNEYNKSNEINGKEKVTENIGKQENNVKPKEDVYTFVRNDKEIQNMISITKRLIIENKENRYSGLVNNVNNINFIIEKSGNIFYPLYEYRIANIVMDNYYPEFYVYAEDVYKNGEYLRTEYYFQ